MPKFYQINGGWMASKRNKRAILTGEFRAPLKGEWYLSGAIPEAYRAPNDLSIAFHICRIVETKFIEVMA